MKRVIAILVTSLAGMSHASAGTVMNLVDKDPAGNVKAQVVISADGDKVRMDQLTEGASIIFLGEEIIILDHREEVFLVMDDAMIEKVQAAMAEMQAQLAAMPPEQRAMVEQMMQGSMPGAAAKPPAPRLESLGSDKWGDYACTRYAVYEGDTKTQELCAASLDDIPGGEEVMSATMGMIDYMKKIIESMPPEMGNLIGDNPLGYMSEIEGFPVYGASFEGGEIVEESTVESVTETAIDSSIFSAPANYRRQDTGL